MTVTHKAAEALKSKQGQEEDGAILHNQPEGLCLTLFLLQLQVCVKVLAGEGRD